MKEKKKKKRSDQKLQLHMPQEIIARTESTLDNYLTNGKV